MARKKEKRVDPKSGKGLLAASIAAGVLIISASLAFSFGNRVKNADTIFPNVYVGEVNVGGLTIEQAEEKLNAAVPARDDFQLEIGEKVLMIEADEISPPMPVKELTEKAYEYGRDGNAFKVCIEYIKNGSEKKEIAVTDNASMDEAYVKGKIQAVVDEIYSEMKDPAVRIEEDRIVLRTGGSCGIYDANEIYSLMCSELAQGKNKASYTPANEEQDDIDLNDLYNRIYVKAEDAYYDSENKRVVPSVEGKFFDVKYAQQKLDSAGYGDTVVIEIEKEIPAVTTESLEGTLFRDLLASCTTNLTSNEDRSVNVELAANACNNVVLNSGDVFSYNETVGKRTAERGFKAAAAYVGAEIVNEIGGGICQVSSSIYYCCLYADLEIVYRTCHRYAPSYVPLGMDATVSWGGPDFKFKNNTEYPIKIKAWRSGSTVTVELYGTKVDDSYIVMDYKVKEYLSYGTKYEEKEGITGDSTVKELSGITGYIVETYKYKYNGSGTLISSGREDTSKYSSRDELYYVAPGRLDENGNLKTEQEVIAVPEVSPEIVEQTPEVTEPVAPEEPPAEPEEPVSEVDTDVPEVEEEQDEEVSEAYEAEDIEILFED